MYYFASDTHLGPEAYGDGRSRERLFIEWLDGVAPTARAIFLLGDVFDFWFEYKRVVPKGFTRLLGKFSELTDRGVDIHFFTGNHDMWALDYLTTECGLIIHRGYEVTELYGRKVFISHGDTLGKRQPVPTFQSRLFHSRTVQWLFRQLHPNAALKLGNSWSRRSRKSKPSSQKFYAEDEIIVRFARKYLATHPDIDLFVCAHIHCPTYYPLTEKTSIAFLGEWFENPVYGVLKENGIFELKPYK